MVPVSPLDDMLTGTLPGEMNAKMACIIFDRALIGPQFVSPNTRSPTSISGSDRRTAINESHTGIPMLKALHGPFPDVVFCPTGGITPETAPQFLALPNVRVCGGSWLTPNDAVEARDWARITALAKGTAQLRKA